jgi:hypothetical protein
MQTHPQSTPVNAQGHRLVRVGEWHFYLFTCVVVLIALFALRYFPALLVIPVSILTIGAYKYFFPAQWVYDPTPEQSPFPEGETQSDTPSKELKSALGSDADELLQVEGRLLDQLATLGVTGSALADASRKFSSTRSQLLEDAKPEGKKPDRARRRPRNPRNE